MYRDYLPLVAAASLVLAGTATAGFKSLQIEEYVGDGWVANGYAGLSTFRLYATFDGLDPDDGVIAVFGTVDWAATVTSLSGGQFHNTTFQDSLTAPIDFRPAVWLNQWDTYVTIGTDDAAGGQTWLSPGFESETSDLTVTWSSSNIAWFVTPGSPQSIAVEEDGQWRVLLGQFTVETSRAPEDIFIDAFLSVLLTNGDAWVVEVPCRVPENLNGDAQVGFDDLLLILANWGCTGEPCQTGHPFTDLNLDGNLDVGFGDLVRVLSVWTVCDPFPFETEFCPGCDPCDADLDGSGDVGFNDLLDLLANWGPCGGCPADFNGDGEVDILDLLFLLLSWGSVCPA